MALLLNEYPYSDYQKINLDWLLDLGNKLKADAESGAFNGADGEQGERGYGVYGGNVTITSYSVPIGGSVVTYPYTVLKTAVQNAAVNDFIVGNYDGLVIIFKVSADIGERLAGFNALTLTGPQGPQGEPGEVTQEEFADLKSAFNADGTLKTLRIDGMTEDGSMLSPNLFPQATLVATGKYVGGINSTTGKAVLYTNATYDTYLIPVDGESIYTFTNVRFAAVVSDLEYTAVGSLISNATQIDSTGGMYVLFSFAPSSYPVSIYQITKPLVRYQMPINWILPDSDSKTPFDIVSGSIGDGEILQILGASALKDGEEITFKGFFDSFSGVTLNFISSGGSVTNYINVSPTQISIKNYTTAPTPTNHGLTISHYVCLSVRFIDGQIEVTLYSDSGSYTVTTSWYQIGGTISYPRIVSNGTAFTSAYLSVMYTAAKRSIWYFGDSYIGMTSNDRWAYYLKESNYADNVLLSGSPGGSSAPTSVAFEALLKYGTPKIAVFATGMNDGSDTDTSPSNLWTTRRNIFLNLCNANNIEPVFATVPTVPTVNNEQKNAWVRGSGYRYIDFAKAVGADGSGAWYSGMLSADNVHPSATGAKALYTQVLIDLPEVMLP